MGILKWKANPAGQQAGEIPRLRQRRKGIHHRPTRCSRHRGRDQGGDGGLEPWFPANFIAETTATELAVLGRDVDSPAANKTYYRVVAVDEEGKRSGPSDYAAAPRP